MWLMIERAGAGAEVWRGCRYIAGIETNTIGVEIIAFLLEDLDALYTEYRSFQRFLPSGFQTLTAQLARPSAER